MDIKELKQAAMLKAEALLPKILNRSDKDVKGRINELALGLKEFIDSPMVEVEIANARQAEIEAKRAEKKAKVEAKVTKLPEPPTKEEMAEEVGVVFEDKPKTAKRRKRANVAAV